VRRGALKRARSAIAIRARTRDTRDDRRWSPYPASAHTTSPWFTVNATSYSACSSGTITASGLPVRFGIVAMNTLPIGTLIESDQQHSDVRRSPLRIASAAGASLTSTSRTAPQPLATDDESNECKSCDAGRQTTGGPDFLDDRLARAPSRGQIFKTSTLSGILTIT